MQCKEREPIIATTKYGLAKGPIVSKDPSSERALRALNISITTKVVNDKVLGFYFPQLK